MAVEAPEIGDKQAPSWIENPYRLVSWWDVDFFAEDLHSAVTLLEKIWCAWLNAQPKGDAAAARLMGQVATADAQECQRMAGSLLIVVDRLRKSGLATSAEAVLEFWAEVEARARGSWSEPLPASEISARIEEIQRTIRREMRATVFIRIATDRRQYYSEPIKGWEPVVERWPETQTDIIECSRCFALERFAASIFHALLVAESGVIRTCNVFEVSGDKPGWGCVQRLERISKTPYAEKAPAHQRHSDLLKDLVSAMVAIKDSTRHKISHVDNRLVWLDADFSPDIASEVISTTRGFMRRLAKDLP